MHTLKKCRLRQIKALTFMQIYLPCLCSAVAYFIPFRFKIQDYYLIIDIKMWQNINHITVHSKTYINFKTWTVIKNKKLHNKQTSNLHTHTHTHTHTLMFEQIYMFRNAIDCRTKLCKAFPPVVMNFWERNELYSTSLSLWGTINQTYRGPMPNIHFFFFNVGSTDRTISSTICVWH